MSMNRSNSVARTVWRQIHQGLTPDDVTLRDRRRSPKRLVLVRRVAGAGRADRRFR